MKIGKTLLKNEIVAYSFIQQNTVSTSYMPGMSLGPRDLVVKKGKEKKKLPAFVETTFQQEETD